MVSGGVPAGRLRRGAGRLTAGLIVLRGAGELPHLSGERRVEPSAKLEGDLDVIGHLQRFLRSISMMWSPPGPARGCRSPGR